MSFCLVFLSHLFDIFEDQFFIRFGLKRPFNETDHKQIALSNRKSSRTHTFEHQTLLFPTPVLFFAPDNVHICKLINYPIPWIRSFTLTIALLTSVYSGGCCFRNLPCTANVQ